MSDEQKQREALTPETMKRGGRYNWKYQVERLVYVGKKGSWHQFEKVGEPGSVWCEVLDSDLHGFEETEEAIQPSQPSNEHCADAETRALYVKSQGSDEGWLGVEGSYFIGGVCAAREEQADRDQRYQALAKAAEDLLRAVDARHGSQPPLKYTIPYGEVVSLRLALDAPPSPSSEEACEGGAEFTTVPVLASFSAAGAIGELRVLSSALPPAPNFVFSLGFQTLEPSATKAGDVPAEAYLGRYRLVAVSPVSDENYLNYLLQTRKEPELQGATELSSADAMVLLRAVELFKRRPEFAREAKEMFRELLSLELPSQAFLDVLAERKRQEEREGFPREHDDGHRDGSLAAASACYALRASHHAEVDSGAVPWRNVHLDALPDLWPETWDPYWWKPTTARRDLVKSAALALAEIERRDRAAEAAREEG